MHRRERHVSISALERRYYLLKLVDAVGPSFVMINNLILLHVRGLSQFQISLWGTTYLLVTFLTDVPTGAFADTVGRRRSYISGCTVGAISYVLYIASHQLGAFLLAATLEGVGTTLRNGSLDAWAVDSLDRAGIAEGKERLFSRVTQLVRLGSLAAVALAGEALQTKLELPWLLALVGHIAMIAAALAFMTDPPGLYPPTRRGLSSEIRTRLIDGLRASTANRIVLFLAIGNLFTLAAFTPYFFQWPIYFNAAFRRGPQVASWIYCMSSLATVVGSGLVARVYQPSISRKHYLCTVVTVQGLALIGSGCTLGSPPFSLMFLLLASLSAGLSIPVYLAWINEAIEGSRFRATVLSFQSTFVTFGSSLGLPIGGRLADTYGFGVAWSVEGLVSLVAVLFYGAIGLPSDRSSPENQ